MHTFHHILLQVNQGNWLFANEKVYTVMAVLLVILGGLLTFALVTDRKVSKLEKQVQAWEAELTPSSHPEA